MQCPECKSRDFYVDTVVTIKQHADDSWDLETPFSFQDSDTCECRDCGWTGTVGETEKEA